jgi:hypothetical protein
MKKDTDNKLIIGLGLIAIAVIIVFSFLISFPKATQAAGLPGTFMRLDRMKAGETISGTTCAKISNYGADTGTEAKVVLNFPTGFTPGTAANFTITTAPTAGWPTTGTTAPWIGIGTTAMTVSGTAVTIASGNLTSTAPWYCFNFTSGGGTTGSAGANQIGSIQTQTGASAEIDSNNYATALISNDQVVITGTVNPTFSFSLSANTATFASITNSTVANVVTAPTATLTTNARNGWWSWVKDANSGTLNSAATGSNIPTPGAVGSNYNLSGMGGTGAFGLGVTTTNTRQSSEYDGSTFAGSGAGTLSNSYRVAASYTAATSSEVITLLPRAIVSTTQAPANDYTDTITIIAAGSF